MKQLELLIQNYLEYCMNQKRLDKKSIKAYRIDLTQFRYMMNEMPLDQITQLELESYIATLNQKYKPKTVKRKIASLKTFFHYLEYKDIIAINPFNKLQIKLREPVILPKTIPLHTIENFMSFIYRKRALSKTPYQERNALRDIAVIEMLFATGIRISELCSLTPANVDLRDGVILIYGKGCKERRVQLGNVDVIKILKEYRDCYQNEILQSNHFFVNQSGKPFSDQAVRRMINKYTSLAAINLHITPHMFRHTFATSLLEADVDIRYIQNILGHSSINITEIYTHVAMSKQKDILTTKHPRQKFHIGSQTFLQEPIMVDEVR